MSIGAERPAHQSPPSSPQLPLPYARQSIDAADLAAVAAVLQSDWLTTGPAVERFEAALCQTVDAAEAVAVSSGTAALHIALAALGVGPDDEVIVPAMTFAATANAAVYVGATPIFADVDPATLLIDPDSVAACISPRTKAIVGVDYAGQPCDYDALRTLARRHGLALVADAAHSLGARHGAQPAGTLADLTTFSFHPVKAITTAEGGAVTTDDAALARRLRRIRNHGIERQGPFPDAAGPWHYEMVELGFNYRLSDLQSALGCSQLERLPHWIARRRMLADRYRAALVELPGVQPLHVREGVEHACHLFVVAIDSAQFGAERLAVYQTLHTAGITAQVHYLPVHLHAYYRRRFGTRAGLCPVAEQAYQRILSLPLFPALDAADVDRVVATIRRTPRDDPRTATLLSQVEAR